MSWDADALLRQIQEADRAMELALHELHIRKARIADLEIENERLRARLAMFGERIRRMEEGEL